MISETIGIITNKRAHLVINTLISLAGQNIWVSWQVLFADNDSEGSAKQVSDAFVSAFGRFFFVLGILSARYGGPLVREYR
jgi:hypothetical protein